MQVVSNLRRWMREMAWRIDQTKLSRDSSGHGGTSYAEIPDFHFETSLEHVSLLEDVAERLFNLIHAKDTANIHVKWCIEFCDADDETFVFDIFCGQSAKLFLDAAALYRCMSEQLGWSEEKFFDQYKAMMREGVERLEAIQADRAASRAAFHQELFGDLTERQNS